MIGLPSLFSLLLAFVVAILVGPLLARISAMGLSGKGLAHLLVEARGVILSAILSPILVQLWPMSPATAIGLAVGLNQGLTVARWSSQPIGAWHPALIGRLALGGSSAAWLTRTGLRRGAIISSLSTTLLQIVAVEALMAKMRITNMSSPGALGFRLVSAPLSEVGPLLIIIVGGTAALELLSSLILQRRSR